MLVLTRIDFWLFMSVWFCTSRFHYSSEELKKFKIFLCLFLKRKIWFSVSMSFNQPFLENWNRYHVGLSSSAVISQLSLWAHIFLSFVWQRLLNSEVNCLNTFKVKKYLEFGLEIIFLPFDNWQNWIFLQ